jgi:hypothetical protein
MGLESYHRIIVKCAEQLRVFLESKGELVWSESHVCFLESKHLESQFL